MKRTYFLEQSRRDKTHEVQLTPYKAAGRSVGTETVTKAAGHRIGMVAILLLALSVLVVSCQKPEKSHLAGTWRWTCTSGGIGGWFYTPESEGFEAEIVFKGSQFTFYKDGEKVTSGIYRIVYDVDETIYTNKNVEEEPFYSWFSFRIPEAQSEAIAKATDGKVCIATANLATLGHSEAEGEVFSVCDNMYDGFVSTFVKK